MVSFKCKLLFSIFMSIYFSIIDIRKYVIKRLYLTSAMTIITKTKEPETRD